MDPAPEEARWWRAMRTLRRFSYFSGDRDYEIIRTAEIRAEVALGGATAEVLEALIEDSTRRGMRQLRAAGVPHPLTRSELIVELCKYDRHRGLSKLEVEELVPKRGRTARTGEVRAFLHDLGGPSSSDPESRCLSTPKAIEGLKRFERFRGLDNHEIGVVLSRLLGSMVMKDNAAVDKVYRGFAKWEEEEDAPKAGGRSPRTVRALLEAPEFAGMTPEEAIDEVESRAGGLAMAGDYGGASGVPPPGKKKPQRDPRVENRERWNAMRKIRSLRWARDLNDDGIMAIAVSETEGRPYLEDEPPPPLPADDLYRFYEASRKYSTVYDVAGVGRQQTRREMLTELSRFERYEGLTLSEVEEEVPRKGPRASTGEVEKHLDALGGPSSSDPCSPGRW